MHFIFIDHPYFSELYVYDIIAGLEPFLFRSRGAWRWRSANRSQLAEQAAISASAMENSILIQFCFSFLPHLFRVRNFSTTTSNAASALRPQTGTSTSSSSTQVQDINSPLIQVSEVVLWFHQHFVCVFHGSNRVCVISFVKVGYHLVKRDGGRHVYAYGVALEFK